MAVVSASGETTPYDADGEPYARFGPRIPALRSFYLGFDVGDATPGDHEIVLLGVMAGGVSEDLSPHVGPFQPANIPDGQLHLYLQDSAPRDEEFFYKASHSTLAIPGAKRYQIRQVGNVGHITRQLPGRVFRDSHFQPLPNPVLALVGFRMFFGLNREHELERVGVWFDDRDLHVVFQDQAAAPTDDYSFLIDFVVIPSGPVFDIAQGAESGRATGGARAPLPTPRRSHLALRGFDFAFQNGDHEIRDIGVDRQGDDFVVFFGDKNGDDPFNWRVEWAHIAPRVFA